MDEYYKKMFSFENIGRMMDNIDEVNYGVRPRGTKREEAPKMEDEPTVRKLNLAEMTGLPVKIK